jgi:hypothetical protein
MCADVDYLDYNPNPHLLFLNHQEAPARPAASLPVQNDIDEDCADFDEFNESPENATANQGHVMMPSPYVLDPSILRSLANGQQSAINQPMAIDYFTRSSDGALCMAITNRFTDETTIRPLPTSHDARIIQRDLHKGKFDSPTAATCIVCNSGEYAMLTRQRYHHPEQTPTAKPQPKQRKKPRAANKQWIPTDNSRRYITTKDRVRRDRSIVNQPTPAVVPPCPSTIVLDGALHDQVLPIEEPGPIAPPTRLLTAQEISAEIKRRRKAKRIQKTAAKLANTRARGPQILQPVTAAQFNDPRTLNHTRAQRY